MTEKSVCHPFAPWLPEVSLYYLRARAYSPTLGRFTQTDPILTAGGMNLYAYVGNDPIDFIDPLGLWGWHAVCRERQITDENGNTGSEAVCQRELELDDSDSILNPFIGMLEIAGGETPSEPWHLYHVSVPLTGPNTMCSAQQVSDAVNRNIIPGSYGQHTSGGVYNVSLLGGVPLGSITWTSNASGTQFENVTNDDHFLRYGSVATTITGDARSGYSANLVGSGNNTTWEIAAGNQIGGPIQFQHQLQAAAGELRRRCGG